MFFQSRDSYTVQKFLSPFAFENFIFISRSLKSLLPSAFSKWFKFSPESHSDYTR